jgi:hypothetical protein
MAGVRVEGGWAAVDNTWRPICTSDASNNDAVVVQAPPNANITVRADAIKGRATLAWLTVKSKAMAKEGESLYGIFARGADTNLILDNVRVQVATAGDGASGAPGAAGADGSKTGCTPPGDGAHGVAEGTIGGGAPAGTFGSNGYVPADGSVGGPGKPGHNGTAAGAGICIRCCTACTAIATPDVGEGSATPNDDPPCECTFGNNSCGGPGLSGCGGEPGAGGSPGHGGGSSIGLYVWDAAVSVSEGSLQAGDGGKGSVGGTGGTPGLGVPGVFGPSGPTCIVCDNYCEPRSDWGTGSTGGVGGNGRSGGQGGGGAGGSSYAVYKGGTAAVLISPSTALLYGKAGTSLGNGAPGRADKINP